MLDFRTIDNRCLDSWHILISGPFKHRYPLNIPCSKIFDSCKIKRIVTNLTQLGYVNSYDKNRYLENFRKQLYALPFSFLQTVFLLVCLNFSKDLLLSALPQMILNCLLKERK